jgi:hypothetical protein
MRLHQQRTNRSLVVNAARGGGVSLVLIQTSDAGGTASLGVGRSTVRTHLQHVFKKVGTHRQAELARLLAQLPWPAGRAARHARRAAVWVRLHGLTSIAATYRSGLHHPFG